MTDQFRFLQDFKSGETSDSWCPAVAVVFVEADEGYVRVGGGHPPAGNGGHTFIAPGKGPCAPAGSPEQVSAKRFGTIVFRIRICH